ncbi:MAG TPA: hypothetical protein VLL54_19715 [Pyrinomonadaceae bacterium]|nr:hypothetical protein [Pyrinomonadaceae bacterium]
MKRTAQLAVSFAGLFSPCLHGRVFLPASTAVADNKLTAWRVNEVATMPDISYMTAIDRYHLPTVVPASVLLRGKARYTPAQSKQQHKQGKESSHLASGFEPVPINAFDDHEGRKCDFIFVWSCSNALGVQRSLVASTKKKSTRL